MLAEDADEGGGADTDADAAWLAAWLAAFADVALYLPFLLF